METTSIINTLFIIALILLIGVSGGILYLSAIKWKNRRLQDREKIR